MLSKIMVAACLIPTMFMFLDWSASSLNPNQIAAANIANEYTETEIDIRNDVLDLLSKWDKKHGQNISKLSAHDMHSKCPSGYMVNEDYDKSCDAYMVGTVEFWTGCSPVQVCHFKGDKDTGALFFKGVNEEDFENAKVWLNDHQDKYGKTPLAKALENQENNE